MNKTARHILRQCTALRNVRSYLNTRNTVPKRYLQTSFCCNTLDKIQPNSSGYLVPAEVDVDGIMQRLLASDTTEQVFDALNANPSAWKRRHVVEAIRVLDRAHRLKSHTDETISQRSEFRQMCEILTKEIRSLDPNDAARILRAFEFLGVPSSSIISQSLLQVIRRGINHASFHLLTRLGHQLNRFESTPLVEALRTAIPIVCELHLCNKMIDTSSVKELRNALLFVCKRDKPVNGAETVINGLLNLNKEISVQHALRILRYLCDTDTRHLPNRYEDVVKNMQEIIANEEEQLSFIDIQMTLRKIIKQYKRTKNPIFYNEKLFDAFAKMIISRDYGFEQGIVVLQYLYNAGHTQIRLIDYLAAKCFENPEVLRTCCRSSIMALVIGLAVADYRPIFWEFIQDYVSNEIKKQEFLSDPQMMNFVISLAVFDCFQPDLLREVFSQEFLTRELNHKGQTASWNILLLYQSVKVLYPDYAGPWPSQRILQSAIQNTGPLADSSILLPALQRSMGGAQYVLSNLRTKLGHHVDHAIVIRKGGYPVAVNQLTESFNDMSVSHVEDLKLPPQSQAILVMNIPAEGYAVNSRRMKGNWTLLLRTLATVTSHTVIPINSAMWTGLPDYEKIPYLMQAIRLKCDDLRTSANS